MSTTNEIEAPEGAELTAAADPVPTPAQVVELVRAAMDALTQLYLTEHHQDFTVIVRSIQQQLLFLGIGLTPDQARAAVRGVDVHSYLLDASKSTNP